MLYKSFFGNFATIWGKKHEKVAIEEFKEKQKIEIVECGFFIDKEHPFLAATPDGLIGERGVVEIKCPSSAAQFSPLDAIRNGKITFGTENEGQLKLKRSHNYFYQVQGQLHITERDYCIFIVWTPLSLKFATVRSIESTLLVYKT